MAKLFIPNDLTRSQLDAFRSIEMELNKLASGGLTTGTGPPTLTSKLQDGSLYYDYTNLNLYVLNGISWNIAATQLHTRYATGVVNPDQSGKVSLASNITGFSTQPFDTAGEQLLWRGTWWGSEVASTDPTDYIWTYTSGADGNNIRVEYSTDGTTWVTTQASGVVYLYIRTAQDTNNDGAYIAGLASKFVPEKGVEYDDGGTVAQLTIYKRSSTALSTPTGGQYNFGTHTLTAPTGWTSSIPTGTDPVYSSVTLANIIGNTGTDTTLTWSSPEITISDGTAGRSVYTTNVYLRQATAPGTPVSDTGSFAFGTNVLTVPTGSPSTEVWSKGMPSGTDPLYASEATFSVLGDTGTDSTVDWGTPRVVAQDGVTGLDGISTYLFSVFQRSATALTAAPTTGSYNFTTNTPTAPTGWYVEVPSGTDPLYVTTTLASTTGPTGSDSTLTWSTPVILAQDGYTPVQGVDYYDGTGIYISYIFITGTTTPTAPTTGSFDGTTETIPTGWQDDPYVTAGSITYVSKRTYTQTLVNGVASTTWTTSTWSTPSKFYERGDDGDSYTGTTEYYKLTNSTTAPTIASGSWLTSPQFPTSSNQYLWNYNVNTRTIGNDINSPVSLITQYVEDGVGISSIGEEYAKSSSGTTAPTSWGTYANALPLSDTSPYLWNKTTTTYTDATDTSTSTIIAIKGIDADALTVSTSTTGGVTTLTFSDGTTATIDDGADGTASGVKIIYASDASGTGASFTQGSLKYANYYEWTGSAPTTVPSGLTYTLFIGEDGDDAGVISIYADDASGTNASLTDSSKDYINFYEWTGSAPTSPPSGLTYVKFVGDDGDSYTGTTEYYKLTNSTTAPTITSGSWSTSPQIPTTSNQYLWNYNVNTRTLGNDINSPVSLVTQYVEDGVGISSIGEQYAKSSSATTTPTSWGTYAAALPLSDASPYLWNKTTTTYTDSTTTSTSTIIAIKGIDADALTVSTSTSNGVTTLTFSDGTTASVNDGATGTASGVKVIYATNASGTSASFTKGSRTYVNYYEWTGSAPTSVPSGLTYTLFVGEDGDNAGVLAIYADDATGTGASLTDSTKDYVNFYEWTVTAPTTIPTGLTYVKFIGTDGVSYTGTVEYYKLTNTSTAPNRYSSGTVIDTGWSTTPSYPTSTNKYLWNFNRNSRSNSTFDDSAVSLITQYVVDGTAGRGISGITEKYQLGTSASTAPTGTWQTTLSGAGAISAANPYLWNQTTIAYSDSSTSTVVVTLIAAKGDEGYTPVKGTDYNDGKGTYISYIFKTVTTGTTAPGAPTTGSYNGTAETFPTGWQGDPLITTGSVTYVSKRTYSQTLVNGIASTTWTASTWSTPSNFYKEGYTPVKNLDYFDGTSSYLHIKYSDDGTSFTANGGEDVGSWIGTLSDSTIADSTTFSDYTWKEIVGDTPTYEKEYTVTPGLLSEIGDPDTAVSGVTWVSFTGSAPSTAYWIAEQFTIDGVAKGWDIFPVQAKDGGLPFVTGTRTGNRPAGATNTIRMATTQWTNDVVAVVSIFTGRTYTTPKEFGYGTVVVITYADGKLTGKYTRGSGGADTWVEPGTIIDGDLVVDGTIAASHIQAASIDSNKLVITGTNPVSGVLTPAYLGAATTAENATAATTANWSTVTDDNSNMPADNATVGATWGTDLSGQPSDTDLLNANTTPSDIGYTGDLAATAGATWGIDLSGQPSDTALLNVNTTPADIGYTGDLDANNITNTSDLTDGANLGGTAAWANVTGTSGVETTLGAAAKVAVVTDNIYTTNTTTIDGSNITTGSITANTIAAGSITADKIEADSITANEIKSVDGSAIISRTYKLNGNNGRVDATVGIDRETASPDRYYWLDTDDTDGGDNFQFPEELMFGDRLNRLFTPNIVNDGVTVSFDEYKWEWQSLGKSAFVYTSGGSSSASTMYADGGSTSFYAAQSLDSDSWQPISSKSYTANELTYFRVVPTSATSIVAASSGDVKFNLVVFASGKEDINTITLSGSSGTYTMEEVAENLENVQLTPRANANVWWDETLSTTSTVSIHSSVDDITIDLVARYY